MKFYFTGLAIGFAFLLFGGEKAVARFLAQNGLGSTLGVGAGANGGAGYGANGGAGAAGAAGSGGCGCDCTDPVMTNAPNPVTGIAAPSGPSNYVRSPGAQKAQPLPIDFGRSLYPLGFSTFLEPEQVQ